MMAHFMALILILLMPAMVIAFLSSSSSRIQCPRISYKSKYITCCHNFESTRRQQQRNHQLYSESTILYSNERNIIDAEFGVDPSNVDKGSIKDLFKNFLLSSQSKLFNILSSIKKANIFNKENITKLGFNVLLSYGWISNTFAITGVIISWVIFGKANNISPLAPGQWKKFLLVYAGVWAANNLLRPIRVSLSIVVAPIFEKFIYYLQAKFKVSRSAAVAIVVFLFNIVGSFSYLFVGLYVATSIAHVPLLHRP